MTEPMILKDNLAMAGLVGCLCVIGQAFINGVVSVQTRMMQHVSVIVTMFYIATISTFCTMIWLIIEHFATKTEENSSFRLFTLTPSP